MGILLALPAIWLVAREPSARPTGGASSTAGLVDGVLAGLGFGTLFAALAQIPEESGFLPLALNQVVGLALVAVIATGLRAAWVPREPPRLRRARLRRARRRRDGLFLVATQTGFLTVAAVITSLYPAFTVVLAAVVLRERVHARPGRRTGAVRRRRRA